MVAKSPVSRTRAKALARLLMRVDPARGYTQALATVAQRLGYANVHAMTAAYAGAPARVVPTIFSHDADIAQALAAAAAPSGLMLLRAHEAIPVTEVLHRAGAHIVNLAAPPTAERRESLAAALRDGVRLVGVSYAWTPTTQDTTLLDAALRRVLGIDLPTDVTLVVIERGIATPRAQDLFPAIMDIRHVSIPMPIDDWLDRARDMRIAPEVIAFLNLPVAMSEPTLRAPDKDAATTMQVSGIEWDTDGKDPAELGLPTELVVDTAREGINDPDQELADWLSNRYGWCVTGFACEPAAPAPNPQGDANGAVLDFSKVRPQGPALARSVRPYAKTVFAHQELAGVEAGRLAGERADTRMRIVGPSPAAWEKVSRIVLEGLTEEQRRAMERKPAPIPAERLAALREELLARFLAGERFWTGNSNAVHGAAGMLDGERMTAVYGLLNDGLVQWRTPRGMMDHADWSLTDKGRAQAERLGIRTI